MSTILDATRNVTTQFSILSSTVCSLPVPLPVLPGLSGPSGYQGLNNYVKRLLKFLFVPLPVPLPVVLPVHDPLLLSDLLGSMNSILVTCKYHTHLIPGVFELLNDIERLDILRLMTFPWQFRYIQKLCMEELYIKWCDFILTGINGYLKIPGKSQTFLVCLRLNSEKIRNRLIF